VLLEQGGFKFSDKRFPGKTAGEKKFPQHKRQRNAEPVREKQQPHHAFIDEAHAATVFISIGKNRRVFPRDLVSLLIQGAHLTQDKIGEIRILDNYSFVQLFSEDADNVIAALNGYKFHGRTLIVSYSRKKDDSAETTVEKPGDEKPDTGSEE
jgi:hypothetical protein